MKGEGANTAEGSIEESNGTRAWGRARLLRNVVLDGNLGKPCKLLTWKKVKEICRKAIDSFR
jgi:hypothetical protein